MIAYSFLQKFVRSKRLWSFLQFLAFSAHMRLDLRSSVKSTPVAEVRSAHKVLSCLDLSERCQRRTREGKVILVTSDGVGCLDRLGPATASASDCIREEQVVLWRRSPRPAK